MCLTLFDIKLNYLKSYIAPYVNHSESVQYAICVKTFHNVLDESLMSWVSSIACTAEITLTNYMIQCLHHESIYHITRRPLGGSSKLVWYLAAAASTINKFWDALPQFFQCDTVCLSGKYKNICVFNIG